MRTVTAMCNGDAVMTVIEDDDKLTDGLKWEDENGFNVEVMSIDSLKHIQFHGGKLFMRKSTEFLKRWVIDPSLALWVIIGSFKLTQIDYVE